MDETEDYIVVDKPPFLLVHPSKPTNQPTLLSELHKLLAFELINAGQVSIINRLDRETSGLVLVAKTSAAARRFGLLMQERRIKKQYLAIVWGWPEWQTKSVEAPLARQGKYQPSAIWLKQAIQGKGAPARTEFRVDRRFTRVNAARLPVISEHRLPQGENRAEGSSNMLEQNVFTTGDFAVVRAIPLTGRTHQIRVHLRSLGHPVVGDKIYGPDEQLYLKFIRTGWTSNLERQLLLPRHALHSAQLAIEGIGEWQSPLPIDLADFSSSVV